MMNMLHRLFEYLLAVIKAILYGWIHALRELIGELIQHSQLAKARRDLPGRLGKAAASPCVPISDPALKRPDPMIYSQFYLMDQGLAVTWNNPDIVLERGGVPVVSSSLLPDTEYEIVARIWNGSTEAPIVGLPVTFSFLSFGAGTVSNPIGKTYVNLGVKGGINHPAFARMKWRTPAQAGHYCLRAAFEWLDDLNPYNNLGQENTTVAEAHSPATLTFTLRNDDRERHLFRFEVDTYAIPPRPDCDQQQRPREAAGRDLALLRTRPGTIHHVPPEHDRKNYRLPPDWTVVFSPETIVLAQDQSTPITVTITPPTDFVGSKMLNIHAFHERSLAGGVTVEITKV
jgi:hypothetical protein